MKLGMLAWPVERVDLAGYAAKLDRLVGEAAGAGAELLLMPEYACVEVAGGYVDTPDVGRELDAVCERSGQILATMRETARRHRVWLVPGSMPVRAGGATRNCAPLIAPDGRYAIQEKRVMTRFESESWNIVSGRDPAVFESPWGRIGIAICYDAEFPVLVRAQVEAGAWLILVPTCTDSLHGFNRVRLSAQGRALENQCYAAVAPTVGQASWSAALDVNRGCACAFGPVDRGFPEDGVLAEGPLDHPGWVYVTLDREALETVRRDGGVRNFRDWPPEPEPCRVLRPE